VLQCVAVCCSVLQSVAVCCSVLQCVGCGFWQPRGQSSCSVLQCVAVCCSVLQCVAVCCSVLRCVAVLQCVAVCCSVLQCPAVLQCVAVCCIQCVAVCCSVLQCVAVCCSVLQCCAGPFQLSWLSSIFLGLCPSWGIWVGEIPLQPYFAWLTSARFDSANHSVPGSARIIRRVQPTNRCDLVVASATKPQHTQTPCICKSL